MYRSNGHIIRRQIIRNISNLNCFGRFGTSIFIVFVVLFSGSNTLFAQEWSNLGTGLNGVMARGMDMDGQGNLYVVGDFTQAGFMQANGIAKFDGNAWSSLAMGATAGSNARTVLVDPTTNDVYASGDFLSGGGMTINGIGRWNGVEWFELGLGIDGEVYAMAFDFLGNLIVGGDFNLAGTQAATNLAIWDGNNWSEFGGGTNDIVYDIEVDLNNEVYIAGQFTQAGATVVSGIGKWDGSLWTALGAGMMNSNVVRSIALDDFGDLYAGGDFTMADGVSANRIAKWDGVNWAALGNGFNNQVWTVEVDANNNVYAGGRFTASGTQSLLYIAMWNGNLWLPLGIGVGEMVTSILVESSTSLYACGAFNTAGSVQANHIAYFQEPAYELTAKSFYDLNGNNIWDSTEVPFRLGHTQLDISSPVANITTLYPNENGFATYVSQDSIHIDINYSTNQPYYNFTLSKNFTDFVNGRKDTVCIAVQPLANIKDLAINVTAAAGREGRVIPGFSSKYYIDVTNVGTSIISNPSVKFHLDEDQSYLSASEIPVSLLSNVIEWHLAALKPLENKRIELFVQNEPIPILNLGEAVEQVAIAYPLLNDQDLFNNTAHYTQIAQGAYDPNDKNEAHNGQITVRQAVDQDWLYYLIRFQNTGTDTAYTITVTDDLMAELDGSTLEMLSASHDYRLTVTNFQDAEWIFDNVLLPDSTTNEPESHGYIHFRIKPVSGLIENDEIENTAEIYFDFNPAIITNTHLTTVTDDTNCLNCVDNALHFDGQGDRVVCPSALTGNADYTLETWFYSENTANCGPHSRIIAWSGFELELAECGGELRFYDGVVWMNTSINIRDGQWHHAAVTKDSANYKLYLDGLKVLDYQRGHTLNFTGSMYIGSNFNGGEQWTGIIDEVRVWDQARSAEEIVNKQYCGLDGTEVGLVAYYNFNQGLAGLENFTIDTLLGLTSGQYDGQLLEFTLDGLVSNWIESNALDANFCPDGNLLVDSKRAGIQENFNVFYNVEKTYTDLRIDYGDGTIETLGSPSAFLEHDYEIPGYYTMSLLLDSVVVATESVLVESCGWQAYTKDHNSKVFEKYHAACDVIDTDAKTATVDTAATALSDYDFHLVNYQHYGTIANDVKFKARVENSSLENGLAPHDVTFKLTGTAGFVSVTFSNVLANTAFEGPGLSLTNLPGIQLNTENLNHLGYGFENDTEVKIWSNDTVAYTFNIDYSLGEVIGLELYFHGSGIAHEIFLMRTAGPPTFVHFENFTNCNQDCPCIYNRHIDYPELPNAARLYEVKNKISAEDTIHVNANIVYSAGNQIDLEPGFEVVQGAELEAKIEGCDLFCNSENPLFDLTFLHIYVGDPLYKITHCLWNGQEVFHVQYCLAINGTDSYFYDCTGTLICHALNNSDPCFTMFTFTDCVVLQGC